jgi:hypothetical protein
MFRAKSEAVKRNQPVTILFTTRGYRMAINVGDPNELTLDRVDLTSRNITLTPGYANSRVDFRPRGGATAGNVLLTSIKGETFLIRTNNAGKIWIERPASTPSS